MKKKTVSHLPERGLVLQLSLIAALKV